MNSHKQQTSAHAHLVRLSVAQSRLSIEHQHFYATPKHSPINNPLYFHKKRTKTMDKKLGPSFFIIVSQHWLRVSSGMFIFLHFRVCLCVCVNIR